MGGGRPPQIRCDSLEAGRVVSMETGRAFGQRTDAELLKEALLAPDSDGSKRAASALLGRYRRRVLAWCLQYARQPEAALDLAQEVLIAAYRNLASYQGRGGFGTWLFAIARNRCISELRRPSLLRDPEVDPDTVVVATGEPNGAFDGRLAEREILEILDRKLDRVEQDAIWLRYFEGMPVEMISHLLHLENPSGARGVLQRARRKLRPALMSRM